MAREERSLCDLYLAKVSELLNFPAPGRKRSSWVGRERKRDARGERERKRERACTVIKLVF